MVLCISQEVQRSALDPRSLLYHLCLLWLHLTQLTMLSQKTIEHWGIISLWWDLYKHRNPKTQFSSVQFGHSVMSDSLQPHELQHARPSPTPEFTQTHVHWVGDATQPSHSLLSPSPPASNPSQHQNLFQWVNSSHEVAKVLEFQLQHQSFQITPRTDLLQNGPVGSPCSPRDSQESSPTPQFKSINSSAFSFLYSPTLTSIYDYRKNYSLD